MCLTATHISGSTGAVSADGGHAHTGGVCIYWNTWLMSAGTGGNAVAGYFWLQQLASSTRLAHTHGAGTLANSSVGVSGTDANLQPYITVAMWKRTA
jgi:hypothetical protein